MLKLSHNSNTSRCAGTKHAMLAGVREQHSKEKFSAEGLRRARECPAARIAQAAQETGKEYELPTKTKSTEKAAGQAQS